ncbi:CG6685 [Drosophila busckii]|uniref:CG6685 n=1 Tax=Drosophila busckii TaxID=30019 RepID=A0A0M4EHQ3_DROBS|nr:uncharacterized protein LOC108600275 [Drosophila busckii]ALC43264.1 CG6685 [Drosophila busckii]
MEDDTETDSKTNIKKADTVSIHTKRTVLAYLKEHGCTSATLEATARARRQDPKEVIDYVCRSYEQAEQRVNEECETDSFVSIIQWLQLMKKAKLPERCHYEQAYALNAIVHHEAHPEPAELGGINMREAYSFLENALTGHPQKKLDAATSRFLLHEFELLIDEANNEESEDEARKMAEKLIDREHYDYAERPDKASFDPFLLDD